jgi:hypothetical protein
VELSNIEKDKFPEPSEPTCCLGGSYDSKFIPAVGAGIFYRF